MESRNDVRKTRLYTYRGGCIFQPVYLGVRDDIRAEECQLSQLKYKADPAREEAA